MLLVYFLLLLLLFCLLSLLLFYFLTTTDDSFLLFFNILLCTNLLDRKLLSESILLFLPNHQISYLLLPDWVSLNRFYSTKLLDDITGFELVS